MDAFFIRLQPLALNLARILIGFAYWTHGGQKLFGWFGGNPVELASAFGIAGVIEFFGGLLIITGLFTRPVAFLIAGQMAVAYWWRHAMGRGEFWHWNNGGELAAVYSVTFLLLASLGGGSLSLDSMIARRRTGS